LDIIQDSIEVFSKVSNPINLLQKKGTNFEWTTKCEESFHHLKELLTSAPILKVEDPNEYFVACDMDACKEGLGGVLACKMGMSYVMNQGSLMEHETNHATDELELADIIHSLKMWRHYLMVRKFKLKIDRSGLKHLFGQPTLNSRQTRWLEFLSEYNFDIHHIKEKENKMGDALSRRVHEMHVAAISVCRTDLKHRILESIIADPHYAQVKEYLQQNNVQHK
jgi:hypothetical protein